jgi:hypothetical protein
VEDILIGVTDRTIPIFIVDPAATDGGGKTGLAHTDITVTYTRYETDNDVVHNDVTSSLNALTNLTDAHNDWGWKEVSATLSPGQYRLDVADALFASGAWYTVLQVTITTSLAAATPKAFRLVARNDLDGVRLGLTALPNAAPDAAGGLPISDAGGLDLDAKIGALTYGTANRVNAQVYGMEANVLTATAINADAITAAKVAADVTTEIQSGLATAAALTTVDGIVDAILALLDDARTEPGQGAPPVNPDLATKIDYLYKAFRNKKTNDGSTTNLYADDGTTIDHKQTTSESGGTVTKAEWITGA